MIHIRPWGRLGNQMFQYAAARLTAERLRCPLLIEEPAFGLRHALRRSARRRSDYALFNMFDELHPGRLGHAVGAARSLSPKLTQRAIEKVFPHAFSPARADSNPSKTTSALTPVFLTSSNTRA